MPSLCILCISIRLCESVSESLLQNIQQFVVCHVEVGRRDGHISVCQGPAVGVGGFRLQFLAVAHQPEIVGAVRMLSACQFVLPAAVCHAADTHPLEFVGLREVDIQASERRHAEGDGLKDEVNDV